MLFKIVVLMLLLFVIINLGIGLFHLVNGKGKSDKLFRSLTWRIGLSVVIFLILIIGQAAGLIQSHGL